MQVHTHELRELVRVLAGRRHSHRPLQVNKKLITLILVHYYKFINYYKMKEGLDIGAFQRYNMQVMRNISTRNGVTRVIPASCSRGASACICS